MKEVNLARRLYDELNIVTEKGEVLIPSAGIYRSIFAWDSGWHFHWLRHLDNERAVAELLTLFTTQYPDGRIPHETPLPLEGSAPFARRFALWMLRHSFDDRGNSWFIDPPVYLAAALEAAENESDEKKKDALRGAVTAKFAWYEKHRLADYALYPWSKLPVIMHPLESGTDFSPSFDEVWGKPPMLAIRSLSLLKQIASDHWSTSTGHMPGYPLVYDLTTVTFYLEALMKYPGSEPEGKKLAGDFFHASFDRDDLLFRQYYLKKKVLHRTEQVTFSSILPCILYRKGKEADLCRAAVERHCLPGKSFWRGRLPSFNPEMQSRKGRLLWRGSCSWMNMNFMLFRIFKQYGFDDEAVLLAARLGEYMDACGPREFFDAFEMRGGGAEVFSWNGLLMAMERL